MENEVIEVVGEETEKEALQPVNWDNPLTLPEGVVFTGRGLVMPEGLSREDYVQTGQVMKKLKDQYLFFVNDYCNYGVKNYGEAFTGDLFDQLQIGFKDTKHALALDLFDTTERYPELSGEHHYLVSKLEEDDRKRWLDWAREHKASAKALQDAIRNDESSRTKAGGIATPHGIRAQFDIWLKNLGGPSAIVEMNDQAKVTVYEELKPVAELVKILEEELRK